MILNNYKVVYDYILDPNSFSLADKMLIPMGGALLLVYIYYKGLKKYKIATIIITSAAILLSALVGISQYMGYKEIIAQIENGDVHIAEGKISNYKPIDPSKHESLESFLLNGIQFAYSDYHRISGYHHACANGGIICVENQEVRLSYYTREGLNYIIKIELPIK